MEKIYLIETRDDLGHYKYVYATRFEDILDSINKIFPKDTYFVFYSRQPDRNNYFTKIYSRLSLERVDSIQVNSSSISVELDYRVYRTDYYRIKDVWGDSTPANKLKSDDTQQFELVRVASSLCGVCSNNVMILPATHLVRLDNDKPSINKESNADLMYISFDKVASELYKYLYIDYNDINNTSLYNNFEILRLIVQVKISQTEGGIPNG